MGIGVLLLERGLISKAQLDDALAEQRRTGERLDRILVRLRIVSRSEVLDAIGDQFKMPVIDLNAIEVAQDVLDVLPAKLVYKQNCVPVEQNNGSLTVATSDPFELSVLDELKLLTGQTIELVLADEDEIHKFIRRHYGVGGDTLDEMSGELDPATLAGDADTASEIEEAQEASVIKLVNDLISEAITERATDIHVEPYEDSLAVRYRIDGVLQQANVPATISRFRAAIVSRIKIMAGMNIAEKRRPQDGRIEFRWRPSGKALQEFDLRVSIIPMLFGEGVVMRLLNKTQALMDLRDLGMPDTVRGTWNNLINQPHGILLVTGPTGSGKSTTLYASLNQIRSDEIKLVTVEDPVEYHLDGVNQIQVYNRIGLTFAAGLRSILRHDPDVIMVGEIRDKETAEVAVQASLTGHLVLSTLHTNDAPGATTRMLDMGVEPFLVSSSVEGILAQRLVRRNCDECAEAYEPDSADIPADFETHKDMTLKRGVGCRACRNTGFRGRVGIYELMKMNARVRELIMQRASAPELAAAAVQDSCLWTLREDGFAKCREGVTTIAEVVRSLKG